MVLTFLLGANLICMLLVVGFAVASRYFQMLIPMGLSPLLYVFFILLVGNGWHDDNGLLMDSVDECQMCVGVWRRRINTIEGEIVLYRLNSVKCELFGLSYGD